MKNSYKSLLVILTIIVALSGCTGAVLRGGMTDKETYQETVVSISGIDAGKGRVFIYAPKGGPNIVDTMGVMDFLSIDKDIYRFGGESFFYLDIETGSHNATITEVVKAGIKNKKQYGQHQIEISIPESGVTYLKIIAQKSRVYKLEMVPKALAESEMTDLPLWTNSATTMKIK